MKYIFYNDLEYLAKKRKKILLLLLMVPIVSLILASFSPAPTIRVIIYSLGLDVNLQSFSAIELIMYLFNISLFIFLVADLYIKDVAYQLDNIFLRIRPEKWFVKKTILFMICMFFMKLVEYLSVFIFYALVKNDNVFGATFIKLFISDYLYVILIQYLFLLVYVISIYLSKHKWVSVLLFVVVMIFIPKSIFSLRNSLLMVLGITLGVLVIIYLMFKINSKKIIESV